LEKTRQAYELWAQMYPGDDVPRHNLGSVWSSLGQYDKALAETRERFASAPTPVLMPTSLVTISLRVGWKKPRP
jgi:hypothetical protein